MKYLENKLEIQESPNLICSLMRGDQCISIDTIEEALRVIESLEELIVFLSENK